MKRPGGEPGFGFQGETPEIGWARTMAAMTPDLRARVDLMLALGERSDAIALRHFQSDGLAVESKSDESPVTIAP